MGAEPHLSGRLRRGASLVHLALRAAADPRLSLLHLGADARRDGGHRCERRRPRAGPATRRRRRRSSSSSASRSCSSRSAPRPARSGPFLLERQRAPREGRGGHRDPVRPAHDGGAADRLALQREARAGGSEADERVRRVPRRPGVRLRMDAVHRSDPRRHPGALPACRTPSARASGCWRSTRSGLGVPFLLTALAINQFFTVFARIRKLLPRDRSRIGAAALRDWRADLHRSVHHHRALALAVPADVVTIAGLKACHSARSMRRPDRPDSTADLAPDRPMNPSTRVIVALCRPPRHALDGG